MSVLQDFEKEAASGAIEALDDKVDLAKGLSRNTRFCEALGSLVFLGDEFGVDLTSIDDEKIQMIRSWLEENKESIFWCANADEQATVGNYAPGLPEMSHRSDALVGTILPELLGLDEHSVV